MIQKYCFTEFKDVSRAAGNRKPAPWPQTSMQITSALDHLITLADTVHRDIQHLVKLIKAQDNKHDLTQKKQQIILNQYIYVFFVPFHTVTKIFLLFSHVITFLYLSTDGILQEQLPLSPSVQCQQPDMLTPPTPQLSGDSSI